MAQICQNYTQYEFHHTFANFISNVQSYKMRVFDNFVDQLSLFFKSFTQNKIYAQELYLKNMYLYSPSPEDSIYIKLIDYIYLNKPASIEKKLLYWLAPKYIAKKSMKKLK